MKDKLWQTAISFFATLSVWVAGPIIAALLTGNWFDNHYQTEPWGVLGFIAVAFVISNIGIVKESKKLMRQMEQESENNDNSNSQQPK